MGRSTGLATIVIILLLIGCSGLPQQGLEVSSAENVESIMTSLDSNTANVLKSVSRDMVLAAIGLLLICIGAPIQAGKYSVMLIASGIGLLGFILIF
jgi:hypothetical protein